LTRGLQLRFENRTSSIGVPNLSLPTADFVAEAHAIPVAQAPGTAIRLYPHKLGIIATATSELLGNANAEDLIRSVLVEASALATFDVLDQTVEVREVEDLSETASSLASDFHRYRSLEQAIESERDEQTWLQ
jgi:hypothetical protein